MKKIAATALLMTLVGGVKAMELERGWVVS